MSSLFQAHINIKKEGEFAEVHLKIKSYQIYPSQLISLQNEENFIFL